VTLRGEVIDFIGANFLHETNEVGGIRHIAVVHEKTRPLMRIDIKVVDALRIERRRTPLYAMNDIAF
jgi:hypothetical protein